MGRTEARIVGAVGAALLLAATATLTGADGADPARAEIGVCAPVAIVVNTGAPSLKLNSYSTTGTLLSTAQLTTTYGDIAFDASGTTLYGSYFFAPFGRIDVINRSTGAVTRQIALTGPAAASTVALNGLSGLPDGTLLGGASGSAILYKIDPATGVSSVYPRSLPAGYTSAGDFLSLDDGDLIAMANASADQTLSHLIRIHPDGSSVDVGTVERSIGMAISGGKVYLGGSGATGGIRRVESLPTAASTAPLSTTLVTSVGAGINGAASIQDAGNCNALGADVQFPTVPWGTDDILIASGLPAGSVGTVTFTTGGTTLCTTTLPALTCSAGSTLAVGTYPVLATYSGTGQTATTSFGVTPLPTAVTAAVDHASVPRRTAVLVTAGNLPAAATGTLAFTSGGTTLCTVTLPVRTCLTPSTYPVGSYAVGVAYSGDASHLGSSASTGFAVTPIVADLTASVSASIVDHGHGVTLIAASLPNDATGTVTFASGGVTLCASTLPTLSCPSPTNLAIGGYPVVATYSGDSNYGSLTATTSFRVVAEAVATVDPPADPVADASGDDAPGIALAATGSELPASLGMAGLLLAAGAMLMSAASVRARRREPDLDRRGTRG